MFIYIKDKIFDQVYESIHRKVFLGIHSIQHSFSSIGCKNVASNAAKNTHDVLQAKEISFIVSKQLQTYAFKI